MEKEIATSNNVHSSEFTEINPAEHHLAFRNCMKNAVGDLLKLDYSLEEAKNYANDELEANYDLVIDHDLKLE